MLGFDITFAQYLLWPPMLLILSAINLQLLKHVLTFISLGAQGSIPAVKSFRGVFKSIQVGSEFCFGKASAFKPTLSHICLVASVLMLIMIYNAIAEGNKARKTKSTKTD